MKILVLENEYQNVKGSFELLNILKFSGTLSIVVHPRTQDAGTIEEMMLFDFIFIDIELADTSQMDGFQILRMLLEKGYSSKQMAILTGHRDMASRLESQGINPKIRVVTKAVTYGALYDALVGK